MNVLLPLFVRSLDRVYGIKVDKALVASVSFGRLILKRIFQSVIVVFFLPMIILVKLLSQVKRGNIQSLLLRTGLSQFVELCFSRNFTIRALTQIALETSLPESRLLRDKPPTDVS